MRVFDTFEMIFIILSKQAPKM